MAQFNIDVDSGIIRISQLIYGIMMWLQWCSTAEHINNASRVEEDLGCLYGTPSSGMKWYGPWKLKRSVWPKVAALTHFQHSTLFPRRRLRQPRDCIITKHGFRNASPSLYRHHHRLCGYPYTPKHNSREKANKRASRRFPTDVTNHPPEGVSCPYLSYLPCSHFHFLQTLHKNIFHKNDIDCPGGSVSCVISSTRQ